MIISQLVYISEFQMAIGTLWETLQAEGWNESQLGVIQEELERIEFYRPFKKALAVERALAINEYAKFRKSRAYSDNMLTGGFGMGGGMGNPNSFTGNSSAWNDVSQVFDAVGGWMKSAGLRTAGTVRHWYWRFFLSYDDEIQYLKFQNYTIQQITEVEKGKKLYNIAEQTEQWTVEQKQNLSRFMLSSMLIGGHGSYIEKSGLSETMRQMALAAVALKRYSLQNKQPPLNLTSLVPAILKQVPMDPMDGQPLRCKLKPDGKLLLYSVGKDGVDNNGDPAPSDNQKNKSITSGKDWVWPEVEKAQ